jgi:hypothetical protein
MSAAAKLQLILSLTAWLTLSATALAQGPWHYQNKADAPPGAIGQRQLLRGGPLPGYFQPVQVSAPGGSLVSIAADGDYTEPQRDKLLAGMLIGQVYRLKIGAIPNHEGAEIFPTVEVIDRLYPPPGQAARFPIPIVLTQEELNFAIDGRYVLRVIYIEDPKAAPTLRNAPSEQSYYELAPGQDAMEAADRLGRPVAILRMGSRVPMPDEDQGRFLFQQPPLLLFETPTAVARTTGLEQPLEAPPQLGRPSRNFLRVPASKLR